MEVLFLEGGEHVNYKKLIKFNCVIEEDYYI